MSVATINNHVLFGQSADWSKPPEWSRTWQMDSTAAVSGKESRNAMRSVARHSLSFQITPGGVVEQSELDDAVRQAKKFGLACAPFWGRGCRIVDTFTGDTLTCGQGWDWQAGDFVYVENASGFEISEVESAEFADGEWTLTLADALTGEYTSFARPLLFGRFSCQDMDAITPKLGTIQISISELTNSRSVQLGEVETPGGAGIGVMEVGSTLVVT